jgi:hypothetical protein
MTRLTVVVIALACAVGCSFKGNPTGDDTSGDDTTGDDTTGDDTSGDDTGDDAPDVDAEPEIDATPPDDDDDDDDVLDVDDNCPTVANTDQFNEDDDDRGDVCDRCPHMTGTDTATSDGDSDADGVGDQCDPRVGMDRFVVFRGFHTAADADGFVVNTGPEEWMVASGQMRQTGTTDDTHELLWRTEALDDVAVATAIHIDAVSGASQTRSAAVIGAYTDAEPDDFYSCALRADNPGGAAMLAAYHYDNPPFTNDWDQVSYGGTMVSGLAGAVTLVARTTGSASQLNCRAGSTLNDLDVEGYTPAGYPGLRALGVTASFDYFFVVELGTD